MNPFQCPKCPIYIHIPQLQEILSEAFSKVSDNIDWAVVPGVKLIPLSFGRLREQTSKGMDPAILP